MKINSSELQFFPNFQKNNDGGSINPPPPKKYTYRQIYVSLQISFKFCQNNILILLIILLFEIVDVL